MEVQKFRKRPVEIEAIQLTLANFADVEAFVGGDLDKHTDGGMVIATLEGAMRASIGDWIIRGVKGEFYPCKPDVFEETYDRADVVESEESKQAREVKETALLGLATTGELLAELSARIQVHGPGLQYRTVDKH